MKSRRTATYVAATIVMVVGLAATGCVGDQTTPSSTAQAQTPDVTETPVEFVEITPAPTLDPVPPEEESVAPRVEERDTPGTLVGVELDTADAADTITFRFDGDVPTYDVRYVDRLERADGDVVLLDGSAVLAVTFSDATPTVDGVMPADVPTNESYDLPVARQVLLATNVGGTVMFGIGTSWQGPFTVAVDDHALTVSLRHR